MYAIVEIAGQQFKVEAGNEIFCNRLPDAKGAAVEFTKVLLVENNGEVKVGAPYVEGASVKATLLKNGKSKKVTVFTYKPKKGEKTKIGHRQPYTKVMIEAINA